VAYSASLHPFIEGDALIAPLIIAPPQEVNIPNSKITTQDKIKAVAGSFGLNSAIPLAIAGAESEYKNVCNAEIGCVGGIGIFQIVQSTFDEQCEGDVYNEDDNIACGIKMMSNGEYWRWKPSSDKWMEELSYEDLPYQCSCIKGARRFGIDIPTGVSETGLEPNTTPSEGVLALFTYKGVHHVAVIIGIEDEGFTVVEWNFERCRKTHRFIKWNDKNLRGFYESSQ